MKGLLLILFACGLAASVGRADVNVHVSPNRLDIAAGTQDLDIVLTSNPGMSVAIAAIGFNFDTDTDAWGALDPSAFAWLPEIMNDPNWWFITTDLPDPVAVTGGIAAIPIPDGVDVPIARLTVTPNTAGEYLLFLGVGNFFDENSLPLQLKGGDPSPFTIVPEAGSLMLLLIGATTIFARRRVKEV